MSQSFSRRSGTSDAEAAPAPPPGPRDLVVNWPNNPTGGVARPEDFRALVVLCDERGIQLLSNEAYRGVELDQASDTVIVALDQKDLKMLIDRAKDLDQQVQKLIRLAIVA